MLTKQEKIDWIKKNVSTKEKAKRMFLMEKDRVQKMQLERAEKQQNENMQIEGGE